MLTLPWLSLIFLWHILHPALVLSSFKPCSHCANSGIWKQSFLKYLCGFFLIFNFSTLKKRLKINNLLHLLICFYVLHPCPKYVISSIEIILNITSTLDITYLGRNKIYYYVKHYPRCQSPPLQQMSLFKSTYIPNYNSNPKWKEYSIYISQKIRMGKEIGKHQITVVMMASYAGILLCVISISLMSWLIGVSHFSS